MSTRDEFPDEIRAHLQIETDRLIADGMTPEAARLAARRAFGNVTRVEERFYESHRWMWLDRLRQDVRAAVRSVARYPIAAAVAVVSLALGIGATTVTLTIRNVVFRKPPLLYRNPDELSIVRLGRADRPPADRFAASTPGALYNAWHDDPALGGGIAAAIPGRLRDVRTVDRTDTLRVRAVTPDFFRVLGVNPELGVAQGATSASPSAILSYRVWHTLFDGRSDVVGTTLWIENRPYTVAAVLPPRFWFSEMNSPIWTFFDSGAPASDQIVQVIVRRPSGVTTEMLEQRLQSALAEYANHLPAAERQIRIHAWSVEGTPLGNAVSLLLPYVLAVSVLLTLVLAIANVAILMIAQWTAREHEIAIRASLGASRWRIVGTLLTEASVIAFCGGILGVCMTFALRGIVLHRTSADVGFFDVSIDRSVLILSAIITLLAGVAVGLAPALYETRRLHANPLTMMASSDRVRQRWRHALVVVEITITMALLVELGAMIDGYLRQTAAQLGFITRPLLTVRVENPGGVPEARVIEALRRVPTVASAAAGTVVPLATPFGPLQPIAADAAGSRAVNAERTSIGQGFFETLGVAMRAGRAFTIHDSVATRTAIVNDALTARLFPSRDAVGRSVWIGQTPYEVVGIVANYSNNPFEGPSYDAKLYLPLSNEAADLKRLQFLIRSTGDPSPLVQTIRREIRDLPGGGVVTNAYTLDQVIATGGQEMLVGTAPLVPLIAIGMLLTTAGIYGVLAFAITRRSRELAVRVAIGATGRDLVRLVAAHSLRLVIVGVVLGAGAMYGLRQIVRAGGGTGSFYDAGWNAFAIPIAIVMTIAALATWIPSRRATRINPALLLRTT